MTLTLEHLPKNRVPYNQVYHVVINVADSPIPVAAVKEITDSYLRFYLLVNKKVEALITENAFMEINELTNDHYEETIYQYFYEGETVNISVSKFGIIASFNDNLLIEFFEE